MVKRKSEVMAYSSAASKKAKVASVVKMTPLKKKQLNSLLKSNTNDTGTNARFTGTGLTTTAIVANLTADQATVTSNGPGSLKGSGDCALINYVDYRGFIQIPSSVSSIAGGAGSLVRFLTVRFNKPLQDNDVVGTLPPVTEVLQTDAFSSMPIPADVQAGRFSIISDRVFHAKASNAVLWNGAAPLNYVSSTMLPINYRVKVNKYMNFLDTQTTAGTTDSGEAGAVQQGLLVLYVLAQYTDAAMQPDLTLNTRVNYTF